MANTMKTQATELYLIWGFLLSTACVNGSYFEKRMLQFEEFRLVNQKALELFGLEKLKTLQSAIFAPFYCILPWVLCFNFSDGNFVKEADCGRSL